MVYKGAVLSLTYLGPRGPSVQVLSLASHALCLISAPQLDPAMGPSPLPGVSFLWEHRPPNPGSPLQWESRSGQPGSSGLRCDLGLSRPVASDRQMRAAVPVKHVALSLATSLPSRHTPWGNHSLSLKPLYTTASTPNGTRKSRFSLPGVALTSNGVAVCTVLSWQQGPAIFFKIQLIPSAHRNLSLSCKEGCREITRVTFQGGDGAKSRPAAL